MKMCTCHYDGCAEHSDSCPIVSPWDRIHEIILGFVDELDHLANIERIYGTTPKAQDVAKKIREITRNFREVLMDVEEGLAGGV